MRKILLLVLIVAFSRSSLVAQPYVYNFDNTLDELLGSGPTLLEVVDASCPGTPTTGSFSNTIVTNSCSPASPTEPVYNFQSGGGIQFDNSGSLIGSSYTIHAFFKFNNIISYHRIFDFTDGVSDGGVYTQNDCARFSPNGTPQVCPNFDAATFHLVSLTRDNATQQVDLYVDGNLVSSFADAAGDYVPTTATTNITLFRDDIGGTGCETGDGAIRLLVVSPSPSDLSDITNTFGGLCALVLPLKLVDFTATKQNSAVELKWITESEENSSHFEVERSTDGRKFSKLTSVPAANTASRNTYNYTDASPLTGTGFYRLKIVDTDGRYKYSSILKINMSGLQKFEVFPNPARESVTISGIQTNMKVRLLNIDGRQLIQKISTGQSMTLDLNNYPAGVYIVTYDDGKTTLRQKIVKH